MKNILNLSLTLITAVWVGCASHAAAVSVSSESRQIVDIIIDENPESLILSIRGNQKLTLTENETTNSRIPNEGFRIPTSTHSRQLNNYCPVLPGKF